MAKRAPEVNDAQEYDIVWFRKIEGLISAQHRHLRGERKEEAIADTMAIFWSEFSKLKAAGRDVESFLFRIIEFAALRVRCGRTLTNGHPIRDVLSARCRFRNGHRTTSLPHSDREPTAGEVVDAMSDDRSPAEQAVLHADFTAWLDTLEGRRREVAKQLTAGFNTVEVARLQRVSRMRIYQLRQDLKESWEAFHSEEKSS